MPQRSKIELLGLVETVIQMYYRQGKRQRDIAECLAGQTVSKAKNVKRNKILKRK